ncbi:hypothetical protein [Streptomyces sp. NBC_00847]|uniref:hypothetical protein n=1 Tax=unclassified Streptomyces TaxID=2593676 RepID=UPI0022520B1B|nr:hypothetical protein [Streptomyces sp. NBC_00847]MCX4878117.1 hypothetical protein [Streptomyces sp. NBC_00847]
MALPARLTLQSDHSNSDGPKRLFQRGLELDLVALVQAAAAWAAETGAAGDLMLSAALHRFDDSDKPVHLIASEHMFRHGPAMPFPAVPAQTTGEISPPLSPTSERWASWPAHMSPTSWPTWERTSRTS